ncbi:Major facilitator superfamily domain,Acetyl-coenzyme A transporter 1 [Cinara cedri]|uniref:Major facilitator superfamily domain,Acetyl-coenzyme A transporter 1 n=1 Tax=Cinara cedri TaxID=506608 RepID=A0A5E4M9M0_9HEMI|nr:Major facilitator superfamily domain,Acetyl-coenzyme A transporter 1 [Cinara cedri]
MEKSPTNEKKLEEIENNVNVQLPAKPNLKGDWLNVFILVLLYTIQYLPHGFVISLPIIFQSKKNITYKEQAFLSIATWPFAMKLLWAPIVESLYIRKLGRRKSWIIPAQYLMGVFLFYTATKVEEWIPESGKPNLNALVVIIGILYLLASLQDIALDGWSLTILKKNNVGHSSTCSGIGLALSELICTVFLLLLTSEEFCNKYLRQTHGTGGLVTIKSFLYFWSFSFMIITTLVGVFKREKTAGSENEDVKINIFQSYRLLWEIIKLPSVGLLMMILLTMRIGFTATDAVSNLKLMDAGVSRDDITMINISMYSFKFFIPLLASKYTSGLKPMSAFLNLYLLRLFWGIVYIVLIYYTPVLIKASETVTAPGYYYIILGCIAGVHETLMYTMFMFTMGFFSRICDKRYGGTYMTMLVTISNLGIIVWKYLALNLVDLLTFSKCSNDAQNNCSTSSLKDMCTVNNGECIVIVNGYYTEVGICIAVGLVWYFVFKKPIRNLQQRNLFHWLVPDFS